MLGTWLIIAIVCGFSHTAAGFAEENPMRADAKRAETMKLFISMKFWLDVGVDVY